MIRANCRHQFTLEDFKFIGSILATPECNSKDHLVELFSDPESLDILLDDERLFKTILKSPRYLRISPRLYFYLLVRRALLYVKIDDRNLSDYIASLLVEYARSERAKRPASVDGKPIEYFADAIAAMENADDKMRFFIQLFIANYALFLAGIFPKFLHHRTQYKAAPSLEYFEKLGSSHFRIASNHPLAQKYELTAILSELSICFQRIRLALNHVAQRFVFLGNPSSF